MEQYEEQQKYSTLMHTAAAHEQQGLVQLRLSTEEILGRIVAFLSGKKLKVKFDSKLNQYIETEIKVGEPIVNSKGCAELSQTIYLRINHHVVQGNFDKEHYGSYLERSRKELTEQIIINCYEWEIADTKLNKVIDDIMAFIEPFVSRLIDNEERKSYSTQFQTRELISENHKKNNMMSELAGSFGK